MVELMEKFGSEISIVDGALGRKSTAISDVSEATILSTGAALSLDMPKVIDETKKTVYFLRLDEVDKNIKEKIKEFKDEKAALFYRNGEVVILEVDNSIDLSNILKEYLKKDLEYFYIRGAITPKIIEAFINSRGNYEKITLLAEDGTKFFLNSSLLNKAKLSGIEFKVLNKINLLFVTINPHSPLGVDFNKEEFKTRLQKEISVPVVNVLGD